MKRTPIYHLAVVGMLITGAVKAQVVDSTAAVQPASQTETPVKRGHGPYYSNNVKVSLSSIALGNYGITYERMLTRRISLSANYRFMPKTALDATPLTKAVLDIVADEGDEITEQLQQAKMSGNAITLEARWYTGHRKSGARGFYLGAYGRYAAFKYDFPYDFEATDAGITKKVPFLGDTKGIGGGALIGVQWQIKRVMLDFTILGAHYGHMSGKVDGKTDLSELSEQDMAQLKDDIEGVVNFTDKKYITATVDRNGVKGDIDAPFPGIKGLSLSIGFNF